MLTDRALGIRTGQPPSFLLALTGFEVFDDRPPATVFRKFKRRSRASILRPFVNALRAKKLDSFELAFLRGNMKSRPPIGADFFHIEPLRHKPL